MPADGETGRDRWRNGRQMTNNPIDCSHTRVWPEMQARITGESPWGGMIFRSWPN